MTIYFKGMLCPKCKIVFSDDIGLINCQECGISLEEVEVDLIKMVKDNKIELIQNCDDDE